MDLPKFAFFKGRIVPYPEARVGILTHTLNYGTGAFGGLRGYWNESEKQLFVFRPADHFRRFLQSARLLCMEFPFSEEDLLGFMTELLRTEDYQTDCYIRPLAYFSDEGIGNGQLQDLKPEISMASIPFKTPQKNASGLHLSVSSWRRIDDNMIPARGKITGSYVNSALAKTDAVRAGFDDTLFLNSDMHVAEGSIMNFFLIRNGTACTPPVTDNILEGITRSSLITLLKDELHISVVERPIDRSEVYLADEAFLCGTATQMASVTRVDHRLIGAGRVGPITATLRHVYDGVVHGREKKYSSWCSPIYQITEQLEEAR
jgi:branched-chain amino acid aminotransferase